MLTRLQEVCVLISLFLISTIAYAAPSITSLSPTSGGAGATVTITGTNFGSSQGTSTVTFNGTTATTVTSWNATTIKAVVPTGATTGNVVVTVANSASNGQPFTVTAPSITSLSPTSGAVGASVTISGSGFGSSQGSNSVTFNGTAATPTNWSATQIKAPAPNGATTGNVVVTVAGLASNGKAFTVKPTPSITGISPTFGAVGIVVTISGANFGTTQGSSTVKFNGVTATPTSWNASQITVPVPSGATTGNVVVHTSGVDTNGISFKVVTLTSISVARANLSLPVASVQQYTATALYSDNSTYNLGANAAWSSSDSTIASVSSTGLTTAVGQGQATIQASFASVVGSTTVKVTPPSFVAVGSLNTPRYDQSATLLSNGKVLIVGGQQGSTILASAELYDPATGTFTATGSLATARTRHTATLLQNGMVLIVGGYNLVPNVGLASPTNAELYNPATGTFSSVGRTANGHYEHTATLLNNGTVLIAGGNYATNGGGVCCAMSEVYDPTSGAFTLTTGQMVRPRYVHTATLLSDGTVLVAGGVSSSAVLAGAEVYSPAAGTFAAVGSLNVPRSGHTATLLNGGKVLVAGGETSSSPAEMYDPVAKTFALTGSLTLDRSSHAAALLQTGSALIVGGVASGQNTGTAELFDSAGQTFTASGSLNRARWGHTATLLNDGTVLIAGGVNAHEEDGAELYVGAGPTYAPPGSLRITPVGVNLLVGGSKQFTAVDSLGHPRYDATWTVDNTSLATITTDSSPILTALASGQVTLTATAEGISAQTQVTIVVGPYAPGTVLWSVPAVPGFSQLQITPAPPSSNGPGIYSTQVAANGNQSVVQALTGDGQQIWQATVPALNANSIPDGSGGLLVTEYQTCNPNQTNAMSIVDLDAGTGLPLWQITAQPSAGANGPLYCYPEAPQMAIRGDGAVIIAALGNTSGLPELMVVDGASGGVLAAPTIPTSTYTNPDQSTIQGYSRIGPPIVSSDGSAYVEYEVRDIAYPPKILSSVLWLMKMAPDNSFSSTQLSSTTQDENLLPGRIIPDGQGGVIATWTISPSNPPSPPAPTRSYQAAHVSSGSVTTYSLPFTPLHVTYGKYPTLLLGQNSTIFATDGADSNNGPQVVALNFSSGAVQWASPFPTGDTLELVVALEGGGVAVKDTASSGVQIVRFDVNGNRNNDGWNAAGLVPDFLSGSDTWNGSPDGSSFAEVLEPYAAVPVQSDWPFVGGNPSRNGSAVAFILNGIPSWGGNFFLGKKPPNCVTVATALKAPLTGNPLARYTDKKQKLLNGGYLTSTACATLFNTNQTLAQNFSKLTSAVTNQVAYDGSHSSIKLYDAGTWVQADLTEPEYLVNLKNTSMSCELDTGINSYPANPRVAVSQTQPPATDVYINAFNYKLLTQSTILHEVIHSLTLTNDMQLKGLLGLDATLGRVATDDINRKLEAQGCAGTN